MSRVLAFDTSGPWTAVALGLEDVTVASAFEDMKRGQAEQLMPLVERVLAEGDCGWQDLAAIAVGIGPGNFTGIRISVAAARGLALGLGIPALPLSTFELLRDPEGPGANAAELVIAEAPRGRAYAQPFRYGRPTEAPRLIDPDAPPEDFRRINLTVTGHRAEEIASAYNAPACPSELDDLPRRMVKLADWKLRNGHDTDQRPAPLYVRPADAAPPSDPPPLILQ